MQQLVIPDYAPQIFWLVVTFVVLLALMWAFALPRIGRVLEQRQKHRGFVCKDCAVSCDLGEHQALPVLRLVRLYAQVWVEKRCLAMRSALMHILVHAPKEDTAWGVGHRAPAQVHDATPASPGKMNMLDRGGFTYNDVMSAQAALLQARARQVAVLQAFHNDRARLDRLTGAHADLIGLEISR